jgi:hypothetical protein
MIRNIHKASGTANASNTTTPGAATTTTSAPSGGQIAGQVVGTAATEGVSLASGIMSGGWSFLIDAVVGVFNGAFGMITSISNTRNTNSANTEQLYWLKAREGNDETYKNTGFYIIIGLAIIAVTIIIILNNHKKS